MGEVARPFYGRFGWAYDLLVDEPVEPWADAVEAVLPAAPARILDAGCGTGRHAAELARRGHSVVLADAAPALLEQARARLPGAEALLVDLAALRVRSPVDAVVCRGVLNDIIEEDERDAVVRALARALRDGGVFVADVRELDATAARYAEPVTRVKTVGDVTFRSRGHFRNGLLHVHERHERGAESATHDTTMRPWTRDELHTRLTNAGVTDIHIGPGVPASRADRLFVTASST